MIGHNEALWFASPQGGVHPSDQPWQCLTSSAGSLILETCNTSQKPTQVWDQKANGLIQNESTQKCVNYDFANQKAIEYTCQSDQHTNDKWSALTQQVHPLITTLPADLLEQTYNALFDQ